MRRGAMVAVLFLVVAISACSTTPARVALYGDSLSFEAQDELAEQLRGDATLNPVVQGGAALCDALAAMSQDLDRRKPNVALIQFSGNNLTSCMEGPDGKALTGDDLVAKYASDAAVAVSMLRERDVTVFLVGAPVNREPSEAAAVNAEYQKLAKLWGGEDGGVTYVDAGAAVLAPNGTFTPRLPCLDTETEADGCTNGQIVVRAPDGIHFCPTVSGGTTPCPVYSSGAHRFAAAMAAPVLDHLDTGLLSGL